MEEYEILEMVATSSPQINNDASPLLSGDDEGQHGTPRFVITLSMFAAIGGFLFGYGFACMKL